MYEGSLPSTTPPDLYQCLESASVSHSFLFSISPRRHSLQGILHMVPAVLLHVNSPPLIIDHRRLQKASLPLQLQLRLQL